MDADESLLRVLPAPRLLMKSSLSHAAVDESTRPLLLRLIALATLVNHHLAPSQIVN